MSKQFGPRQRRTRFIKEYLLDKNGTRAAIAAGYSPSSAHVTASQLIRNPKIRAAIERENEKINARLEVTVERVRDELAKLAFFDPRAFFNDDGSLKPISELDDDTARAVAGIDVNELFEGSGEDRAQVGYAKKLKLADKGLNLERLGRYLKMFTDKLEVEDKYDGDIESRIEQLERELGISARAVGETRGTGGAEAPEGQDSGPKQDQ